jgi:hypothetical protein
MKLRSLVVAGSALAALAAAPAAQADVLTQTVTGAAADSIALSVPVAAVFGTAFTPGTTVHTTAGAVTAVSTNPSWTLNAKEASGDGKMSRTITTGVCANSTDILTNAPTLTVTPVIANASITSTAQSLTGSDKLVAAATAVPLAATVFTTDYAQTLPASEILATGCTYSMTTTYTLAAGA